MTEDPDRIDEFRHGLSVGRQLGIDFQIIGPSDIASLCPLMSTDGVVGALYEPIDGYVDPAQATHAMARLARAGGARVLRQSPVQTIEPIAGGGLSLESLERLAHTLKSSSGIVGGRRMAELCARLEHSSRDGVLDEASALLQQIVAQFAELSTELDGVAA